MAQRQEWDRRGLRSSAVVLFLTGVALAGCVAMAVGVTVRLVDTPRPRVSAALAISSGRTTPGGTSPAGNLALVGSAAAAASAVADAEAAKLAGQRAERAQRASRSTARKPMAEAPAGPARPTGPRTPRHHPRFAPHP